MDAPTPRRIVIPLEPLRQELRRRGPTTGRRRQLAQSYVDRFGGQVESVRRHVERMVAGEYSGVLQDRADNWCTLFGLHLDILWPQGRAS